MPRGSSPPAPPAAASNHPHNPHLDVAVTCLWILTPLSATLSLVIVCIAMTTNHWLHTEEKMQNPNYNGTGEKDYLSKYTVSGLWTLCYTNREYRQHHFTNFTFNLFACTYIEFMALLQFRSILQNTNSVEGDTMQGRTRGEGSESGGEGGKVNISKENCIFRCQQMLG